MENKKQKSKIVLLISWKTSKMSWKIRSKISWKTKFDLLEDKKQNLLEKKKPKNKIQLHVSYVSQTEKNYNDQPYTTVRETGVSLHHGVPTVRDPLKPLEHHNTIVSRV